MYAATNRWIEGISLAVWTRCKFGDDRANDTFLVRCNTDGRIGSNAIYWEGEVCITAPIRSAVPYGFCLALSSQIGSFMANIWRFPTNTRSEQYICSSFHRTRFESFIRSLRVMEGLAESHFQLL